MLHGKENFLKVKVSVLSVGKLAAHFRQAQEFYTKRIKPFAELKILEFKDKGRLFKSFDGFKVLLDERGELLTSEEFALLLKRREISFAVGPADGFLEKERQRADFVLSLSKLTLQHDLARILLLEQIYRGLMILRGHPYHRA